MFGRMAKALEAPRAWVKIHYLKVLGVVAVAVPLLLALL